MKTPILAILVLTVISTPALAFEANQNLLSEEHYPLWETIEFDGLTQYTFQDADQKSVLKAKSEACASGLILKASFNIKQAPYLNWSWKIEQALPAMNEESKAQDDYAARIYVITKDGWFFWQTKALNYVWSSRKNPPESWPNAYAPDNAIMLPLQNANSATGQWIKEKRNVFIDMKNMYGKEFEEIEAIAIMTDTDNSKMSAQAAYRDLFFSAK